MLQNDFSEFDDEILPFAQERPQKRLFRRYTIEEIESMPIQNIPKAREEITANINQATAQIEMAKAKSVNGEYVDSTWFVKCKGAIRFMQQLLQIANRRTKENNIKNSNTFDMQKYKIFVKLVKDHLGEEMVINLLQEAERITRDIS